MKGKQNAYSLQQNKKFVLDKGYSLQLVEVKVSKDGIDKQGTFKVTKDETYNVILIDKDGKGSDNIKDIDITYTKKDEKKFSDKINNMSYSKFVPDVEKETIVTVKFNFSEPMKTDNVFYIVVEKEEKPKDPVQNPDSGTTTPDPAPEA